MAGDFRPILQKLRWGHQQLTRLYGAVGEYLDLQPYMAIIKDEPEREGYTTTFKLRMAPPPRIPLIAGDALNAMQGALDYLAWQLVLREGRIPGVRTEFPLRLPDESGALPDGVQILDGKGKEAISDGGVLDALHAVQPYQDGDTAKSHPLFVLKRLNRETKHRHLPLLIVSIPSFQIAGVGSPLPKLVPIPKALREEGSEESMFIAYADSSEGRAPEEIEVSPLISLEQIGDIPEIAPGLVETLVTIWSRINKDIIPRFQPFFA